MGFVVATQATKEAGPGCFADSTGLCRAQRAQTRRLGEGVDWSCCPVRHVIGAGKGVVAVRKRGGCLVEGLVFKFWECPSHDHIKANEPDKAIMLQVGFSQKIKISYCNKRLND